MTHPVIEQRLAILLERREDLCDGLRKSYAKTRGCSGNRNGGFRHDVRYYIGFIRACDGKIAHLRKMMESKYG